MSRRSSLALIIALIAIAAVAVWYFTRTTAATIEVSAVLTEDGPEVTEQLTWTVGTVEAGSAEGEVVAGDLIGAIEPVEDAPNTYEVPGGATVMILGEAPGYSVQRVLSPAAGESVTDPIVLDAGLVELTVRRAETPLDRVNRIQGDTISPITDLPDEGAMRRFVEAGAYTYEAVTEGVNPVIDSAEVSVAAGDEIAVTLDVRARPVTLVAETGLDYDEALPQLHFSVVPSEAGQDAEPLIDVAAQSDGTYPVEVMAYGDYRVTVRADEHGLPYAEARHTVDASVGADSEQLSVPFGMVRVEASVTGDGAPDRLRVIETGDRGEVFAASPYNPDGPTVLGFMPMIASAPDLEFTFGVAAANEQGQVIGLSEIGQPEAGETVTIDLAVGEGMDLCTELYDADMCQAPAQ